MRGDHLKKELEWFDKHRAELLKEHRGKWAVVHNQDLFGVFDSFSEAASKGVEGTGSEKLLVMQVLEKDEPIDLSVNLRLGLFDAPTSA